MRKKLQVALTDEAWSVVTSTTEEANSHFKNGFITCSDVVTEMILNAKIDIKALQGKHTNIRKSLRLMASEKEIDIDSAIKSLLELKARAGRKVSRGSSTNDELNSQ